MSSIRKYLYLFGGILGFGLAVRYLLPVMLPFLLGTLLALAAEPAVNILTRRLPRPVASGVGVGATILLLLTLLWLTSALVLRQLRSAAQMLPDLQNTATQGISMIQTQLTQLAGQLPSGARDLAYRGIDSAFGSSTAMLEQLTAQLPGKLTGMVGKVSSGALGFGTGIFSAFLISARLPRLRRWLSSKIPAPWKQTLIPALARVRTALGGWLKAQGLLMSITFGILCIGFLLLRIPYGIVWALVISLVDAVPMLGSGIALIPWAVTEFFRQQPGRGIGLIAIWAAAMLTRTVLEPRLVGKQIGIDPLLTLIFMYAGFRFIGVFGLLLAPITAAAIKAVTSQANMGEKP